MLTPRCLDALQRAAQVFPHSTVLGACGRGGPADGPRGKVRSGGKVGASWVAELRALKTPARPEGPVRADGDIGPTYELCFPALLSRSGCGCTGASRTLARTKLARKMEGPN